jgi:RNA polymerase sigma factor (sigma-70 family)
MCLFIYAFSAGIGTAANGVRALRMSAPARAAYTVRMDDGSISIMPPSHTIPAAPQSDGLDVLLGRICAGDQAALAEFYDATVSRVLALARRITRQAQAAEEVVADVYLQVWQQASRYDASRGRVLTWLLTICRSRALDRLRRRDEAELHPTPDTLRPDLYRDDADPLSELLVFERKSRVHDALATLGDSERRLLLLAFFDGMSHQEIADHTGMPLGSVKTVVRRGIITLRAELGLNPDITRDAT